MILEQCKGVHCVDLDESFQTHIYYLLAKFGFDTAENEPCQVCPIEQCSSNFEATAVDLVLEQESGDTWLEVLPAKYRCRGAGFCEKCRINDGILNSLIESMRVPLHILNFGRGSRKYGHSLDSLVRKFHRF